MAQAIQKQDFGVRTDLVDELEEAAPGRSLDTAPMAPHRCVEMPEREHRQDPPVIGSLVEFAQSESDLRVAVTRYVQDLAALGRRYPVQYSPQRRERMTATSLRYHVNRLYNNGIF
jgi:hypothetical protein